MKNMTPEHAKEKLTQFKQLQDGNDPILCGALDIAIASIDKAECEDCVSRKAVLELLQAQNIVAGKKFDILSELRDKLFELPAVAPKEKIAEWIVQ